MKAQRSAHLGWLPRMTGVLVLATLLASATCAPAPASRSPLPSEFLALASKPEFMEWMVGCRRHLHQWPELFFEEFNTSLFIRKELDSLGITYRYPFATNGILGQIGSGSPIVALRADMDALPIDESGSASPFASKVPGVMHACGHDTHMSMLLAAGRLLKSHEASLEGTVLLMFQPAEEAGGGAKQMIKDGALEGVSAVGGLHVWPSLPAGTIATKPGPIMAASDRFDFSVLGKGGHGAMPHFSIDPVVAASAVVLALQTLVSRETSPTDGAVVTVARFNTGPGANNVIPDAVSLSGTVRALSQDTFERLHRRLGEVALSTAQAYGCNLSNVEWSAVPYPVTRNDAELAETAANVANELASAPAAAPIPGVARVLLDDPSMAAEDFSFYGQKVPAVFSFLGIKNEDLGVGASLHNPMFMMNEDVMPIGAAYHASLAIKLLRKFSQPSSASLVEIPKAETPKAETPKVETPKAETPKAKAPKAFNWGTYWGVAPVHQEVEAPEVEPPEATHAEL